MKKIVFLLLNLFASAIYAADGDLDTSFGSGGIVNETFGNFSSRHNSVVIQPDGKILVAGNALAANFTNDFSLVRYNPNGTPDNSFDGDGKLYADVGGRNDIVPTVLLQPDGKIVLVGQSKNAQDRNLISIFRFNADGTTDMSFGTNGVVLSAFTTSGTRGDTPGDAVLQPDGKIVVAGAWQGTAFCVGRFNANGSVDNNFGTNGNLCATTSPAGTGLMNS
ncbi:MAG TPA: delta-60 repeat domain-containing protein, partial [Pyrinomonadaceae bacterium]|nr:delta-60 repeat domain-containing protein [Pyrinomonadaceae bacterium]